MPLKEGVDAKTPVPKQVLALSPEDFFNRLNRLLVTNPPEPEDPKTMARLATLGIAPGATFRMDASRQKCARRSRQVSPTGSR